jgi:hypothetical protein
MVGIDLSPQIEAIMSADLPEIEKLSRAYVFLISQHIEIAEREVEVFKALGDQEALVKEQIKANTMAYTLNVFRHLYLRATGRKVSDE